MATIDFWRSGTASITSTSSVVLPAMREGNRRGLTFASNTGAKTAWLGFGAAAVAGTGAMLAAGGTLSLSDADGWQGSITAICGGSDTTTIAYAEGIDGDIRNLDSSSSSSDSSRSSVSTPSSLSTPSSRSTPSSASSFSTSSSS